MAEMKTLNGYEIVDAKARQNIADLVIPVVPTKVSAFENDSGYITEHQSLEGYATETFVDDAVTAHKTDVDNALLTKLDTVATNPSINSIPYINTAGAQGWYTIDLANDSRGKWANIPLRDSEGHILAPNPYENYHVVNKQYLDEVLAAIEARLAALEGN